MHKISWTVVALLVLTLNGLAQSDVSKSRWKSTAILIDGNDREWTKPLNFYDDKSGLLFAISNDQQNVYFAFTVKDEMKMRRLMGAGWSVGLSSKEKNRKFNASLTFPGVKMEGIRRSSGDQFERKVAGNPVFDAYRSQLQSVEIKGFQSEQPTLPLNNRNGIDVAIGADNGQFIVYEIAIPLNELMAGNTARLDELITLNVTVNALDRPSAGGGQRGGQSGRGGNRSGGGMSEMGGQMQGGGMGGGRSGGGRGGMGGGRQGGMSRGGNSGNSPVDRSGLFEKVSFKQKFTLSKHQAI